MTTGAGEKPMKKNTQKTSRQDWKLWRRGERKQNIWQVLQIMKEILQDRAGPRQVTQHTGGSPLNLTKKPERTDPSLHSFGLRVIGKWNAFKMT
jgi:hypothetical protein